ncbi:NADH:ubiquinone reductase (Na(+)-transporting) subunit D [Desulfosudis oleivorans]|uniref:Na(+)-translocating NADH-quinone reductase subunit D n=1 Tax=Desulfosudis oleivorans (strain DSM 6200 / JCM 39069 / Hxd3) TaxID=96561 RepID=A8ZWL2_DESOH|nr:NADH:ubiquinone reductase (Na(+)-transporting) subunit D [Desulfosudis oleivorans]ABW68343.1 NADH:ubiquinone oxidoreductase, subunit D [Desulfosudis oleivorans Hxd3]
MKLTKTQAFKTLAQPVWENNPINIQMLGICSALAVTVQLKTALVMGLAMTFVVSFSSLIISALRNLIPRNIRIIVELAVISSLVILCDEFLKAFMYDTSKQLSVFVGLIITNCIVLGRAESFALANPPHLAFLDGLGNGAGYASVLIIVAAIRELLGAGKLLGVQVIPGAAYSAGYEDAGFMLLAPAAFIIIGLLVWLQKSLKKE